MATPLVIVESPAKARTIAGFLGSDVAMQSSVGHVRDLPRNAAEVPEAERRSWEILAVDVDNDFKPLYIVHADKKAKVRELKAALKSADQLYLATDEDREGEAIAWHLLEVLNPPPSMPIKRMVFHEITRTAIEEALAHPRDLDRRLVDAQETRRLLDRIYGYGPVADAVRRKIGPGLSVGRVQSVATRLVVERERERMKFRSAGYWDLIGTFNPARPSDGSARPFSATLVELEGLKVATGRDFDDRGRPREGVAVLDEPSARALAVDLEGAVFTVRSVQRKPYRQRPAAPFITSTLQQEAGRKLRLSAGVTMQAAQALYENGFITYMRTDSTTLSETAISAARAEISRRFGDQYRPETARQYTKKVKNAQEAHEAIRPAGETFRSPEQVAVQVSGTQAKLYELIWQRTVASQMTDATGETVSVHLGATGSSGREAGFATSGTIISHPGFRLAYVEDRDEVDTGDDTGRQLPALAEGDALEVVDLEPAGHETKPPARFTEASLVKRLEELGVGRPSTYASIMNTIQDRGYVWKKGSALVPSFTAFAVINLLEQHFGDLVDYAFTARMEDDLDRIASGDEEQVPYLASFYFGPADQHGGRHGGLKEMVEHRLDDIDPADINSIPIGADPDGVMIVAKPGRQGSPYLKRGEDTASIPDALAPDEITVEKALELLAAPKGGREIGVDPETGLTIYAKTGRYGPYVQLGELVDGGEKPKMASLFQTMTVERVTLDEARQLLALPRVVGTDPTDGAEIVASNGRYGPYLKKTGTDGSQDTRSLSTEEQLLTVSLDEALTLFAQPKMRRGQASRPPLKELGNDPVSGRPMVVKDGRFGLYVTDGETNASLRKGDDLESLSAERAAELLQIRREAGPAAKRPAKKSAKKAAKKSAKKSAKKAAKKSAKKAAKKSAKKAAKKSANPSHR